MRAIGLASIDATDALRAIDVIECVHAVDANQQHVADAAVTESVGLLREYRRDVGHRQKKSGGKSNYSFAAYHDSNPPRGALFADLPIDSTARSAREGRISAACSGTCSMGCRDPLFGFVARDAHPARISAFAAGGHR